MLNLIVHFSLRHWVVVSISALLLFGLALLNLTHARYDVFPEFAPPQVEILTEAPGFSSEEVELLVTQIVEQAISGAGGITKMRSSSIQGLSAVEVSFDLSSDIMVDRQNIGERLADIATRLPAGVGAPTMSPLASTTDIVMGIGLTAKRMSATQLRTFADWQIKPQLLSISGVADVQSYGGLLREVQIQVRPEALIKYGLSFDEVVAAARNATGVRGAGVIDTPKQRISIKAIMGASTLDAMAKTPLTRGSAESVTLAITLGDVADVVEGAEVPFSASSIMGEPGVLLLITSQYGANTLEVTRAVEVALRTLKPLADKNSVTLRTDILRPASFIEKSLSNVNHALIYGAALVVIILLLFLNNWRGAIISALAIPLSLVLSAAIINLQGMTLNTMTLGGLAIALGLVVDDAVIDVDNMLRRLRHAPKSSDNPKARIQLLLQAAMEVRAPVMFATLAVAVVSLPIIIMPGIAGRFFAPLGIAYALATLISLAVALTFTPALASAMLRESTKGTPRLTQWLHKHYSRSLKRIIANPRCFCVIILIGALLASFAAFHLSTEFIPELHEGHFIMHMDAPAGTSLDESIRMGNRVTASLHELPYVTTIVQQVGRTEGGIDVWGTSASEFNIALDLPLGMQEDEAKAAIEEKLKAFDELDFEVNTFLTERVDEVISGYRSDAVINLYGPDLTQLAEMSTKLMDGLKAIPGITNVQLPTEPTQPELQITLDQEALHRWALEPVTVLETLHAAFQGENVAQLYDQGHASNLTVILKAGNRDSMDDISGLHVATPSGEYVALDTLAKISQQDGRSLISRDGGRRVQPITFNITGADPASVLSHVQLMLAQQSLPSDMLAEVTSLSDVAQATRHTLLLHSLLAGIAVIVLLSLVLDHASQLALISVNIPFALMGGILILWATGGTLSLGALVGFITLLGITLRNSVMILSHYRHVIEVQHQPWNLETLIQASGQRLLPVLMTALVTGIGLLPIALNSSVPGREIEGPMALVILGGLISSTVLNLLCLPWLTYRYAHFDAVRIES